MNRTNNEINLFVKVLSRTYAGAFWLMILIVSFLLGGVFIPDNTPEEITNEYEEYVQSSVQDSVYSYIYEIRLEHPDIVMAQCIEESHNFKSERFIASYNCTGMKVPLQRPTISSGIYNNHCQFSSWKDCINDYAIWQSIYCRGLTRKEYLLYLDRVYAVKDGYADRLIKIIKSYDL